MNILGALAIICWSIAGTLFLLNAGITLAHDTMDKDGGFKYTFHLAIISIIFAIIGGVLFELNLQP